MGPHLSRRGVDGRVALRSGWNPALNPYEFRTTTGTMASERRNVFQHGEMALVLLALLRDRPMHGYELRSELERVLPGYRASPGAVYPALAALVEERLLEATHDSRHERRRSFKLTAAGRSALERRRSALAAFEVRTGSRLSNGSVVEAALDRFRVRVLGVAERLDADLVVEELDRAATRVELAASERGGRKHG